MGKIRENFRLTNTKVNFSHYFLLSIVYLIRDKNIPFIRDHVYFWDSENWSSKQSHG